MGNHISIIKIEPNKIHPPHSTSIFGDYPSGHFRYVGSIQLFILCLELNQIQDPILFVL